MFYIHKETKDGHLNKCKECTKKDSIKHRENNIERVREYDRNRPNAAERVIKNTVRVAIIKEVDPEGFRKAKQKAEERYRKKYPEKAKARDHVNYALETGRLKRSIICQRCKAETHCEAHHEDYTKPLDVIWLCDTCHKKRHVEIRKQKRKLEELLLQHDAAD